MPRIPFFGGDDDDTEKDIDELEYTEEVGDLTIASNSDITVHRPLEDDGDDGGWLSGGPRVHTVSLSDSETGSDSGSATTPVSPGSSVDPDEFGDTDISSPAPEPVGETPSPTTEEFPAGTFVLPRDKHFLQKLEARGRNGHGEFVETVYVLTGPTPTQPTDLVRLESPELYGTATRTSVEFSPKQMAREVAKLYPDEQSPGVIARFHTHPPHGSVTPSSEDRQSAPSVRRAFVDAFGTDDFEFFHGIHQLEPHDTTTSPDSRQSPRVEQQRVQLGGTEVNQEYITWLGEQYQHRLAVFGRGFASLGDVALRGDRQ